MEYEIIFPLITALAISQSSICEVVGETNTIFSVVSLTKLKFTGAWSEMLMEWILTSCVSDVIEL